MSTTQNAVNPDHDFITVIGNRTPKRKSHTTLGNARRAISSQIERRNTMPTLTEMSIHVRDEHGNWKPAHEFPAGITTVEWDTK